LCPTAHACHCKSGAEPV
jgi:hypothetical protein